MIQDFNSKFDNSYKPYRPLDNDSVICFKDKDILIKNENGIISFPCVKEIKGEFIYLFKVGSKKYFLSSSEPFGDYEYYDYKILRGAMPKDKAFAGITAFHLYNWYSDNIYCGRCSQPLHHSDTQRALVCDSCANIVYPKICPAVIVAITDGNRLCMTKYNRPNAHWALVAGFNEIGETIEETVHREVMEETGLKVKDLKYYKSQPWGFTSTMLYGFFCTVDGDNIITLDNNELQAGKWFTADEIDFDDDGLSLTREMINYFKTHN